MLKFSSQKDNFNPSYALSNKIDKNLKKIYFFNLKQINYFIEKYETMLKDSKIMLKDSE
jgi:hypothetical protein